MKSIARFFLFLAPIVGASYSCLGLAGGMTSGPVNSFALAAKHFVGDPARHQIYASISASGEVAVIDTATLTVKETLSVGSGPEGMSISSDKKTLYVALSGEKAIGVIDLDNLSVLPKLPIAFEPRDIEAGLDDRLYIAPVDYNGDLIQVDATTGMTQSVLGNYYENGFLEISPNRTSLYFGDTALSPGSLYRYDVSTSVPALDQMSDFNGVVGSGKDLKLSHNGLFLCFPSTSVGGVTQVNDSADLNVHLGTFTTGATPGPITFGPDDAIAYQYRIPEGQSPGDPFPGYKVHLFDTATFRLLGTLEVSMGTVSDLITDESGRFLFVANEPGIEVYDLLADATSSIVGSVGGDFAYQPPIYFSVPTMTAAGLPPGLTFDSATRTISGTPNKEGTFTVTITLSDGADSATVTVTIDIYPNSRAQNISTRALVGTGDDVLIAGFIVTGAQDKKIVLRGIGPSLKVNSVPVAGRLLDPRIDVYTSTGFYLAANDNWPDDQNSSIVESFGLQPPNAMEPALYQVLAPGAYTMIISGVNSTTGVALAEVYDLDSQDQTTMAGGSRLANISTRGKVVTGDNVMIGGFIVSGDQSANLLIRAIGPSLAAAGVPGPLADPQMDLYDSQGTKIDSNDNWRDTQEAEIQATGLGPTDDHESAINTTLAPGAYTAIVSGVGGTSGLGLVEAYNLL